MTSTASSIETPAFEALPWDELGSHSNNTTPWANHTDTIYRLGTFHRSQNVMVFGLKNGYWDMLANHKITWANIEDYVDAMECIAILGGRVLLAVCVSMDTHGKTMKIGKIFVQTVQDPSEMEDDLDLLQPLLEFYHDSAKHPRCEIWKATKWCDILKNMNRRWQTIGLGACEDVTVQMSTWLGLHARLVMMTWDSTFEDGGTEFSRVMEKDAKCTITHLILHTNELDWDIMGQAIKACPTLNCVSFGPGIDDMDKCIQAIVDNQNIHEAHVFGDYEYQPEDWTRWLMSLIDCKHLRTIDYSLESTHSPRRGERTTIGDAMLNSIKSNGCVSSLDFHYPIIVEGPMWGKIQEAVKGNLVSEKVTETINWIDNQTDKAWMLDCLFSSDKIRCNKSALFKTIFGTNPLLIQLHQDRTVDDMNSKQDDKPLVALETTQ